MDKNEKKAVIMNTVCAVLMLCLVVCQFLPFWGDVSVQGMIWFPTDHKDVEESIRQQVGSEFAVDDLVLIPLIALIAGVIGVVLALKREPKIWVGALGAVCGTASLIGYLTIPALRTGSLWGLHLALSLAVTACAVLAVITVLRPASENT